MTWGSAIAGAIWIVGSLLLSWYVANFGTYNATYGSLGAVIGFMVWMWLSTIVVLVGAEINAEMEHQTAKDTTEGPASRWARGAPGWPTSSGKRAPNSLNKSQAAAFCETQHNKGAIPHGPEHIRRSDQMSDLKDKAGDQFTTRADQAESVANRVADQGREAAEGMQDVAGNLKGAIDKSIKDQPMATLAVAAVAGFVLGAIWKS